MHEYLRIAGAVALPFVGGMFSGYLARGDRGEWLKTLKTPSFQPPGWVFGPIWTGLYTSMGYASYLVWRDGGGFGGAARVPLIFYGTQLALNWLWPQLYFGQHNLKWSFIDLLALTANAAVVGAQFYGINKTAGYIFAPYLAWLSFAGVISYHILRLNPEQKRVTANEQKTH